MACMGCKGANTSKSITPVKNVSSGKRHGGQQMQRVMHKERGMGGGMTPISHAMPGKKTAGQMMQKRMRGH